MPRNSPRSVDAEPAADPVAALRRAAIERLARREHGRRELAAKLVRKGFDSGLVATVLAELEAKGLQSDERYAASYLRSRCERGHGPRRIEAELRGRGVDGEVIERVFTGAAPDWVAVAARARIRRFGDAPPRGWPERARQARFLEQRGFSGDQIRAALEDGADGAKGGAPAPGEC